MLECRSKYISGLQINCQGRVSISIGSIPMSPTKSLLILHKFFRSSDWSCQVFDLRPFTFQENWYTCTGLVCSRDSDHVSSLKCVCQQRFNYRNSLFLFLQLYCSPQMCSMDIMEQYLHMDRHQVGRPTQWRYNTDEVDLLLIWNFMRHVHVGFEYFFY